jgi:hypothetical protein
VRACLVPHGVDALTRILQRNPRISFRLPAIG